MNKTLTNYISEEGDFNPNWKCVILTKINTLQKNLKLKRGTSSIDILMFYFWQYDLYLDLQQLVVDMALDTLSANYEYSRGSQQIYCTSKGFKIKAFPDHYKANE